MNPAGYELRGVHIGISLHLVNKFDKRDGECRDLDVIQNINVKFFRTHGSKSQQWLSVRASRGASMYYSCSHCGPRAIASNRKRGRCSGKSGLTSAGGCLRRLVEDQDRQGAARLWPAPFEGTPRVQKLFFQMLSFEGPPQISLNVAEKSYLYNHPSC